MIYSGRHSKLVAEQSTKDCLLLNNHKELLFELLEDKPLSLTLIRYRTMMSPTRRLSDPPRLFMPEVSKQ
jgi:hypothetical protein